MSINPQKYRVKPGEKVKLTEHDPQEMDGYKGDKQTGKEHIAKLTARLEILQESLYAANKHSVLVVLQGMDTCGKDGTIRRVFEGVNPQGVRVASFKVPTPLELSHDYLWRVHQQTPARGEMVIFNRSHYEDVLVVRVHELVKEKQWRKRYAHINHFEQILVDEGTTILKFFLHISPDEQKQRLIDRLDEPGKNWKFNPGDLKERARWQEYMQAYEDVLSKTSTSWAPWYIIPADRKWYRDLVIATVLIETLEKLDNKPPAPYPPEDIARFKEELANEQLADQSSG